MTLTATATKIVTGKVSLSSGAGRFSLLNATGPEAPRRFLKEVLRVGRWVHPTTGEVIDIDQSKLERLVGNTQRWLSLGHKVFFPDGHTSSALANLGWWSQFFVDGDQAFGVLEVQGDAIVSRLGNTIRDVSVGIWWNPKSSVAPGEDFSGGVFEHVCATPDPVVNAQPNFQALSRGSASAPTAPVKGKESRMLVCKLDRTALAKAAAGIAPGDAAKLFLGLPMDSADNDVVEAMRQYFLGLGDEAAEDDEQLSTMSRKVAELEAQISTERDARSKERAKRAGEKVHAARVACARSNRPIADEKLKRVEVLLSREDAESQTQGQELLDAHLELAGASVGGTSRTSLGGGVIVNPDRAGTDDARLKRHAHLARAISSNGAKVERDSKGFIVAINGKPYTK